MKLQDTDKTQPERLPHDATFEQRIEKFTKIIEGLKSHGINLLRVDGGSPVLEHNGSTLTHNIITWEIFKVDEVISMILHWKDNHPEQTNTSTNTTY